MSEIAAEIATEAARLVGQDRAQIHGDALLTHEHIAAFWRAYLSRKEKVDGFGSSLHLSALDVANMLELFKLARSLNNPFNRDNYVDGAGYAAIAGEIAERMK